MYRAVLCAGVAALLISPSFSYADNGNVYEQCQEACAGDGLSCLNKCLASNNQAANTGNNGGVAIGNGQAIADGQLADAPALDNLRDEVEAQNPEQLEGRAERRLERRW